MNGTRVIQVAKLNSYSCSKCGGILNFDEGMELFACPFCGNEFGVVDIHRGEIIAQAEAALRRRKFDTARDIYKTLLVKNPHDFEALLGMILVAGQMLSADAFDDIEKAKGCNFKAARTSLKAAQAAGSETDYFNRLSELLKLAEDYKNAKMERVEATQDARKSFQSIADMELREDERKERQNDQIKLAFYQLFPYVAWVTVFFTILISASTGKENLAPFIVLLVLALSPLAVFTIRYFYYEHKKKTLAAPGERNIAYGHRQAETLTAKARELSAKYYEKLAQLKALDPTVNGYTPPAPAKVEAGPDPFVDVTKTVTCAKCGGQLFLDKEKRLYECKFCGVGYGTSLFFNEPLKKARTALKATDYTEADKRFQHLLMVNNQDFEALVGRILCAGRWQSIYDIDLEDKLLPFMEDHLTDRTDEAVQHSSEEHKDFFFDMQKIVTIYVKWAHLDQNLKSTRNAVNYVKDNAEIKFDRSNLDRKAERELYEKQNGLKNEITNYKLDMKKLREEFNELKASLIKRKVEFSAEESD